MQHDRAIAFEQFLDEHLPGYATWRKRRSDEFNAIHRLADARYPRIETTSVSNDRLAQTRAIRDTIASERRKKDFIRRRERAWGKAHPNPLTLDKKLDLTAAFNRVYVPIDWS